MGLEDIIGSQLLKGDQGTVQTSELNDVPAIALYFSAHWCPPCKMFTPKLVKYYNNANASSKQLEIVFISGDETEDEFQEYYGDMPWLATPFDEEQSTEIMSSFGVSGIPALVVVSKDGTVINAGGRDDVEKGVNVSNWVKK